MSQEKKSNILPVFSSHYSYLSSILTFEEAGKTKAGNPTSICDIAKNNDLKKIVVVDERIDGFIEAYKNLSKIGVELIYGIKICVCGDSSNKTDDSRSTESNIIIFVKNTQGYSDLIRIYNRAWTDGFYDYGRTDWKTLKEFWTPNLTLALPFFSSFVARNLLNMCSIVPDFPEPPILFREIESGLPFAKLIEEALTKFASQHSLYIQDTKSIYYEKASDYDAYVTFRAIGTRGEFTRPQVDHMCSDAFSFESWNTLSKSST